MALGTHHGYRVAAVDVKGAHQRTKVAVSNQGIHTILRVRASTGKT